MWYQVSPAGDHGVEVGAVRGPQHGRGVLLQGPQRLARAALVPGAHGAVREPQHQQRALRAAPQGRGRGLALCRGRHASIHLATVTRAQSLANRTGSTHTGVDVGEQQLGAGVPQTNAARAARQCQCPPHWAPAQQRGRHSARVRRSRRVHCTHAHGLVSVAKVIRNK